LEQGAVH